MSNEMAIHSLNERVSKLEKAGLIPFSRAEVLRLRDGDVLRAHIPGNVSMEQADRAQEVLRAEIGDFVEERTGAKIRVIVTTGDLTMSVLRKEEALERTDEQWDEMRELRG